MGKNIKGFKSFNEEIYLRGGNHADGTPHGETIIDNDGKITKTDLTHGKVESSKSNWWGKNSQRLIYYTGNPTALLTLKKEHPDKASKWDELDEIGKAKLLFDNYTIEELEEQLKEFEDIDD